MRGNGGSHPGRSVDFLSRLHDGELDAAERARFEAHRAHCAECRRAAREFEDTISLFRSARSNPPRSDLASRILRKVQSTNRPRAPFSRRFRFDLGWAALLVTALLALLVMTPVVRREPPRIIPIRSVTALPPASARAKEMEAPTAAELGSGETRRTESRARPPAAGKVPPRREPEASKDAAARSSEPRQGAKLEDRRDRDALTIVPEAARAGGAEETAAAAEAVPPGKPLKMSFQAIDGFGSPPTLLSTAHLDLPVDERGREYVVLLDAQGIVRGVTPPSAVRGGAIRQGDASGALFRLRFAAGNRPRRLLVRFE